MSDTFKQERAALAAAVAGEDFPAHEHLPARLVAPCAVIMPGAPYVEAGDTFGAFNARFEVWVIVQGSGDTRVISEALDTRLEAAAIALRAEGFTLERIEEPAKFSLGGAEHLASIISVTTGVTFP